MDIKKILGEIENVDEITKKLEEAIGKEYVPRTEFNSKNNELKEMTTKYNDLETSNKGFTSKISELEGKVKAADLKEMKIEAAREHGLSYDFVNRIIGEDKETIMADAKALAETVGKTKTPPPAKEPVTPTKKEGVDGALMGMLKGLR